MVWVHLEPVGSIKCCHSVDLNCPPWSMVMVAGTTNLEIQPVTKAWATDSAVMLVMGIASCHQVKQSMQVRR